MIKVNDIATDLDRVDGIWWSKRRSAVSHPEQCQDWYRAVEDDSYWFEHRAVCIVECLRMFNPNGLIFDIGGGNGHVCQALKRARFDPVLVEPSVQAVRNAQRRGISTIICATLEDAGIKNASASAMGLFDVLEHIDDDVGFLTTLSRLMVPGGRLYLTVPAYALLWSSYDEHVGHYRRYTIHSLTKRLRSAGFDVEFATYLYSVLPAPILLFRSIPTWFSGGRSNDVDNFAKAHGLQQRLVTGMIKRVLKIELSVLKKKQRIPFGSSCLVVARKTRKLLKHELHDDKKRQAA